MAGKFVKVYDLNDDPHGIIEVQRSMKSVDDDDNLLVPLHLIPGSPAWWMALKTGVLSVGTAEGFISRMYDVEGSRMGDIYDAFDVDEGARTSAWDRLCNQGNAGLYRTGSLVKVNYLLLLPVTDWGEESRTDKVALDIWLANPAEPTISSVTPD